MAKLEVNGKPVGNACAGARTYAQTDRQPENIMPPTHLLDGRTHKMVRNGYDWVIQFIRVKFWQELHLFQVSLLLSNK